MCETRKNALRIDFNQKLKLEFHGTKANSDAGLPKPVKKWSLRTLHEKLIKIGAKGSGIRGMWFSRWQKWLCRG